MTTKGILQTSAMSTFLPAWILILDPFLANALFTYPIPIGISKEGEEVPEVTFPMGFISISKMG